MATTDFDFYTFKTDFMDAALKRICATNLNGADSDLIIAGALVKAVDRVSDSSYLATQFPYRLTQISQTELEEYLAFSTENQTAFAEMLALEKNRQYIYATPAAMTRLASSYNAFKAFLNTTGAKDELMANNTAFAAVVRAPAFLLGADAENGKTHAILMLDAEQIAKDTTKAYFCAQNAELMTAIAGDLTWLCALAGEITNPAARGYWELGFYNAKAYFTAITTCSQGVSLGKFAMSTVTYAQVSKGTVSTIGAVGNKAIVFQGSNYAGLFGIGCTAYSLTGSSLKWMLPVSGVYSNEVTKNVLELDPPPPVFLGGYKEIAVVYRSAYTTYTLK